MLENIRARIAADTSLYPVGSLNRDRSDGRIGKIEGIKIGHTWENRKDVCASGVHTQTVAGISGSIAKGAYSVVLSGGYVDDVDNGETITYTGTGGRKREENRGFGGAARQTSDQTFDHPDNKSLQVSCERGTPIRIVRAVYYGRGLVDYYRYDGLYDVKSAKLAKGRSGYDICQYILERRKYQDPLPSQ